MLLMISATAPANSRPTIAVPIFSHPFRPAVTLYSAVTALSISALNSLPSL